MADLFGDRQALVLALRIRLAARRRARHAGTGASGDGDRQRHLVEPGLCGYATDYGRLAPAFTGVRSYALPILSVELNPLHPTAGRGTLVATLRRVNRSTVATVPRIVRSGQAMERCDMTARREVPHRVLCRSAERGFPADLGKCSAIITDPPYYDYIAYSDLSLLHRSWLEIDTAESLAGAPIYPIGEKGDERFARRLGRALRSARRTLASDAAIARIASALP